MLFLQGSLESGRPGGARQSVPGHLCPLGRQDQLDDGLHDPALPLREPHRSFQAVQVSERKATQIASDLDMAKIENQHLMLRVFDPLLGPLPKLKDNSFSLHPAAGVRYARFFWARYFKAAATDLFAREKRQAQHPRMPP